MIPHLHQQLYTALHFAIECHATQSDRDGGPYVLHVLAVAARTGSLKSKVVALLHDTLDAKTPCEVHKLKLSAFDGDIVDAVIALTRRPDEDYDAYVARVLEAGDLATEVMIASLEEHVVRDTAHPPSRELVPRHLATIEKLRGRARCS